MADVNDNTKNFIDQLSKGNNDQAGEAFKSALRDKVANSLDNARKDIAGNLFKQPVEAEAHSDPKPEIADPGVFNKDGSISPTPTDAQAKDGEAQIDLASKEGEQNAGEQTS
tara:strand:+ start:318 stop:653 length:336 start_codon:yes stop_codon:yes gene_type:complete